MGLNGFATGTGGTGGGGWSGHGRRVAPERGSQNGSVRGEQEFLPLKSTSFLKGLKNGRGKNPALRRTTGRIRSKKRGVQTLKNAKVLPRTGEIIYSSQRGGREREPGKETCTMDFQLPKRGGGKNGTRPEKEKSGRQMGRGCVTGNSNKEVRRTKERRG